MEFLTKAVVFTGLSLMLFLTTATAQCPYTPSETSLVLRQGLAAEIVYDGSAEAIANPTIDCAGSIRIGRPEQIAIDPQTGELYLGNNTDAIEGVDSHILIVNSFTGAARTFPYFGFGLAFNKDGSTFYFGLSNLMLGVWYRDINEYRKFSILPGVANIVVIDNDSTKGRLLVANSDFGKNILGVDTVWEVDQSDGYYQAVMRLSEGSTEVSASIGKKINFTTMDSMAVDGVGNIYTLTAQGKILIRKTDGSYVEGNSAPVTSSGLMQGGLGTSPDGVVYGLDTSSAEVFAYFPDGNQVMVGFGGVFQQANGVTDGGIASDDQSIYLVNAQHKIIRIFAIDGSTLQSNLRSDLGSATLNGTITDGSGTPLPGVSVRLRDKNIATTTTNTNGDFQFNVQAGLYHVQASLANYGDFNSSTSAIADQSTDLLIGMASFLPGFLAPGLIADIIATKSADNIEGSSDVSFDKDGHLYSLNHANGTITKTILDAQTREVLETFIAIEGGGLSNAWFVAIGDDFNIYTSSSNSGLLRLPPVMDADGQIKLVVDPGNANIVRDQDGINRMVSFVTDIDGAVKMSNGDIMFTSGTGGSIIPGFPEGTINTLIRYNPLTSTQTLFSRGIPASGGETVFLNPDVLKVDAQDLLYVTNEAGNVVRVDTMGTGELIWPGNGAGYPEGLSSYTAFNADQQGNMFLKGANTEPVAVLRMIDPANDRNLLTVASQLSPSSAFGGFEFDEEGRSVILSEWDFVLRIRAADGRTIAENIVNPPTGVLATFSPGPSLSASVDSKARYIVLRSQQEPQDVIVIDPVTVKLPKLWAFSQEQQGNAAEPETSSGGAITWLIVLLLGVQSYNVTRRKVRNRYHH